MTNDYCYRLNTKLKGLQQDLTNLQTIFITEEVNRYHRLAAEQFLQELFNACIGIAKHRCKQLGYPAPDNAYVAFERLSQHDVASMKSINWKRIIGMRNALVHDYLNINPEIIEQLIRENEYSPLVSFAQEELDALGN